MKQKLHAVATALAFCKLKAESERLKAAGFFKEKVFSFFGQFTGLPSLIGGTMPSYFFLDKKVAKKSRLSNLWLELLRIVAQSGAVSLHSTSSLCFINNTPQFLNAKSSEAGLAGWICEVGKLKVESERLKAVGQFRKKQLTRRLPQPLLHKAAASGFAMTLKRKSISVKIRPNLLMFLLIVLITIGTKRTKAQGRALQIGDAIPEAVWNTPLQVLNHPEGKTSITLNDYKGKLIILDFWATWCVNCVKSFPEEDRLQKEFKDEIVILPVSTQKQSVISAFMQRDNPTKGSHLTVVTDDQILSETFKHQLMPHVVWINGAGRFVASTAASYVQAEKIQQVLKGEKLNWTMKRDFMTFNKADALMGWVDGGGTVPKMIGYSAFIGHLSGVDPVAGLQSNEAEGSQRRYDINMTLGTFSVRAFEGVLPVLSKKQYLFEVKDITHYICPAGTLYMDWKVQHTYCYEAVLPTSFDENQIKQKMREDLKSYFGLEGKLEYRKVSAWVFDHRKSKSMELYYHCM